MREEPHEKVLRFAAVVSYKAIPAVCKGRKVGQRGGGEPKITFRAACVEGCAGRLLAEPGPRRTEDSKPRVSGPSKAETANRMWEANQRYEATEPAAELNEHKSVHAHEAAAPYQQRCADVVRTDSDACSKHLEPEAITADKCQEFMVEVKEAKRWADVKDSE